MYFSSRYIFLSILMTSIFGQREYFIYWNENEFVIALVNYGASTANEMNKPIAVSLLSLHLSHRSWEYILVSVDPYFRLKV